MIWENEVIEGSAMSIYSKRFKDLMKDNNYSITNYLGKI